VLYVIICGAGTASAVGRLIELAQARGWDPYVIATPAALDFVDIEDLEARTGHPVRSEYTKPGTGRERSLPHADAIVVAPATYNTINKWAVGISDTFALGILAEAPGLGIPVAVLPFVNAALAANPSFHTSVETLRSLGIRVLLGPGQWEPHPPGTGGSRIDTFPWDVVLEQVEELLTSRARDADRPTPQLG
jgi:phosphopantothenoylcysteine synthetase/decarboxylase